MLLQNLSRFLFDLLVSSLAVSFYMFSRRIFLNVYVASRLKKKVIVCCYLIGCLSVFCLFVCLCAFNIFFILFFLSVIACRIFFFLSRILLDRYKERP